MATIYIDNKPYEVDEDSNLLEACLSNGFDLPYFCWHPAMGSVGACRQCAVKQYQDENDTQGKLVMSCMIGSQDQTRISVKDEEAVMFRKGIIESLMLSHPHDCPTCDEGGECHLQDMTVMSGHNYRRYNYNKRTHRNQDLGPFINHEMNRCITCYRCIRFYREFAGGRDLHAQANGNRVFFGRSQDGPLENEFSGNLAEVCPTGVFTDKTYKQHYTRKWDLTTAPSVCQHCSLGCNTIPGERYGLVRRVEPRYNGEVNGYFLCDRGRFGYEYVNNDERIRFTAKRSQASGKLEVINKEHVLNDVANAINESKNVIGIGSPRASLESNYTLRKLVGEGNFYNGAADHEQRLSHKAYELLKNGPAKTPSLRDTQNADAVFVLGEDLTNTAPMLALYLRQTVKNQPRERVKQTQGIPDWHEAALQKATTDQYGPFFVAAQHTTKLDDIATDTYQATANDIARLGHQVAHKINDKAPAVKDLPKEVDEMAGKIAEALQSANRPLVASGTSLGSEAVMEAAANIAWALCSKEKQADLSLTLPEANSMGTAMMEGQPLSSALEAVENDQADTVIILENDLYRRSDRQRIDQFLSKAKNVIVLDHHENETTNSAHYLIPSGSFAESDGTMINNEGRAQRFYQVFVTEDDIHESWRWLREVMVAAGRQEVDDLKALEDYTNALINDMPVFQGMHDIVPPPGMRTGQKIPRAPHRYSGRTAMKAHINVSEPKPPEDQDTPYSFTMEGFHGRPATGEVPYFWSPGWNSPQSINKYQLEVGGKLQGGDPGRRLIEPNQSNDWQFFDSFPEAFKAKDGEWLIEPLYHIFGSDELSMKANALQQRGAEPYVALNPEDAKSLEVENGVELEVTLDANQVQLPVAIKDDLPKGTAGIPVGLPNMPGIHLPQTGSLKRLKAASQA